MKKAFILFPVLISFLAFSLLLQAYSYASYVNLLVMRREKELQGRYEVERQVIERIKKEFFNMEGKDFETDNDVTHIKVTYRDLRAQIEAEGKWEYQATLKYNDAYGTVLYYRYRPSQETPDVWQREQDTELY